MDRLLWGCLLGVGAFGVPLGLGRLEPAPLLTAAINLDPHGARAPLGVFAAHLLGWVPVGDLPLRANLAAILLAALGGVTFGKVVLEALGEARLRMGLDSFGQARVSAAGRLPEKLGLDETVAALAGALLPFACFGGFSALTADPGAAATFWVTASLWLHGLRLLRVPWATREGLWLFWYAGLALGAEPVAALLALPLAVGFGWTGLRAGERWPLLAPLAAMAGAALVVGAEGAVGGAGASGIWARLGAGMGELLTGARAASWMAGGGEALAQVGVLAALLGAFGGLRLLPRLPWVVAGLLYAGVVALSLAGAVDGARFGSGAWVVLLGALALPMAAGVAEVAASLGPARAAAALVVAVVALVGPALDGGSRRWPSGPPLPQRLLVEAHASLPPASGVDPGSQPMLRLLELGAALGLRPDLEVAATDPNTSK